MDELYNFVSREEYGGTGIPGSLLWKIPEEENLFLCWYPRAGNRGVVCLVSFKNGSDDRIIDRTANPVSMNEAPKKFIEMLDTYRANRKKT